MKIDIFSKIPTLDKTLNFKDNLLALFDAMLNRANITDQKKLAKLARIRATIDIQLKDF